MLAFDPIELQYTNIEEWLSNEDNFIIYTDENDKDKIICLKKSYFNNIPNDNIISKLIIEDDIVLYKYSLNSQKYINLLTYGVNVGVVNLEQFKNELLTNNIIKLTRTNREFYGMSYNSLLNNENSYEHSKIFSSFDEEKYLILQHYTCFWDGAINGLLREGEEKYRQNNEFLKRMGFYGDTIDSSIENIYHHINVLDNLFLDALKVENEIVVFRGTMDTTLYTGINEGYISTSEELAVAENFSIEAVATKSSIYEMHLHKGVPFIYLDILSQMQGEKELLLPRGLNTVLRKQVKKSNHIYYVVDVYLQNPTQFSNQNKFSLYNIWNINNNEEEIITEKKINRYIEELPIDEYSGEIIQKEDQVDVNGRLYSKTSLLKIAIEQRDNVFIRNINVTKKNIYVDSVIIRDPFTRLEISNTIPPTHFNSGDNNKIIPILPTTIIKVNISGVKDITNIMNLNLIELKMNNINIDSFSFIKNYDNLEKLSLSYNKNIKKDDLSNLNENLKNLSLSNFNTNDILFLNKCTNLEILKLEGCNNLNDISNISNFQKLKVLDLKFSNIKIFPELPKNIIDLDIMGVNIEMDQIFKLKYLTNLSTNSNKIDSLEGIQNLKNLKTLLIDDLKNIDLTPLSSCKELSNLYLNYSKINDISGLSGCINLIYLNLSDTLIENIDVCKNFSGLKSISINNTSVSSLLPLKDLKFLNNITAFTKYKLDKSFLRKEIIIMTS